MNSSMIQNRIVTVFGAYGHTGRFVVRELLKRGFTPILSGRDASKLKEAGNSHPGSEVRGALGGDPAPVDPGLFGPAGVVHFRGAVCEPAGAALFESAARGTEHL